MFSWNLRFFEAHNALEPGAFCCNVFVFCLCFLYHSISPTMTDCQMSIIYHTQYRVFVHSTLLKNFLQELGKLILLCFQFEKHRSGLAICRFFLTLSSFQLGYFWNKWLVLFTIEKWIIFLSLFPIFASSCSQNFLSISFSILKQPGYLQKWICNQI